MSEKVIILFYLCLLIGAFFARHWLQEPGWHTPIIILCVSVFVFMRLISIARRSKGKKLFEKPSKEAMEAIAKEILKKTPHKHK
jgi:hypothetical protein